MATSVFPLYITAKQRTIKMPEICARRIIVGTFLPNLPTQIAQLQVLKSTSPFAPLMPTHSTCIHWNRTSSCLTAGSLVLSRGHVTQFPWANAVQDQPGSRSFEEVHKPQSAQHCCSTAVPGWSGESADNVCDWAQMWRQSEELLDSFFPWQTGKSGAESCPLIPAIVDLVSCSYIA